MRRALSIAALALALAGAAALPGAALASPDPYVLTPQPTDTNPIPPAGELEAPCGLAVDASGSLYVSDYAHNVLDRFSPGLAYTGQLALSGPCGVAVDDEIGKYAVNRMHGPVLGFTSMAGAGEATLDPGPATGVAIDPASGYTYVDDIDHISAYKPDGSPVEVAGAPLVIGEGSLIEGYGLAVSGHPATAGYLYVPDAASNTVKVYDPASDPATPVEELAIEFTSLRDSAVAVDDASGEVYVADALQPGTSECPEAAIRAFAANGAAEGRLKYNIVDAYPPGLAVDNSGTASQGRVYVTSGNSEASSVMLYQPHSAGPEAAPAPPCPSPLPPGLGAEAPLPEPPSAVTCVGDSCQQLPSEPRDPTLTTLLEAPGDGPVRFFDTNRVSHVLKLRGHGHRKGGGAHGKGKRKGKGGKHPRRSARRAAAASSSSIAREGNLQVKVSGSIAPKRLPREAAAPVSVSVGGEITTTDQSPPPELEEMRIDLNRNGHLETKGLPLCRVNQIHPASTQRALSQCARSLVGQGSFGVDVVLAGQEPYPSEGRLLLFNGTYEHRHALLGQIYSPHPFANSFVIPFVIHEKKGKGLYGLSLAAKLPAALTSWGRVTALKLELRRSYSFAGKRRSFISASCPAPKGFTRAPFTLARTSFRFADSRTLTQTVSDQCRVRP